MFVRIGSSVVNADCISYLSIGPAMIELNFVNHEKTRMIFFNSDEERDAEFERVSAALCFTSPEEVEYEEEAEEEEAPREDL